MEYKSKKKENKEENWSLEKRKKIIKMIYL